MLARLRGSYWGTAGGEAAPAAPGAGTNIGVATGAAIGVATAGTLAIGATTLWLTTGDAEAIMANATPAKVRRLKWTIREFFFITIR